MLHILNTLERDTTKKFVDFMNFGMENITNEYFLKVLYINNGDKINYNKTRLDFAEHNLEHNLRFEDKIFRFFEDIFKLNKLDIMVFTHYDLSMLMFFKNEDDINTYVQLAKINDLILKDQESSIQNKPLIEVV